MTLDIRIIRDEAAFAALEPSWWELWRRAPAATPFQSPAWLLPWWDIFHPGQLCVAAAWAGEALVGLAPFYVETGAIGQRLLPIGSAVSDYLDLLQDPEEEGDAVPALSCGALASADAWGEWELTELSPWAVAARIPCPEGCSEENGPASTCFSIPVAEKSSPAELLPMTRQRKLRMAHHRAARRGELCILSADETNVSTLMEELIRLNRLRRGQLGERDSFADPRLSAFHQTVAPLLLRAGILRLYALMIGPGLTAVYYGFHWRGRSHAYLGGFDPAFSYESPGSILLSYAIKQAVAEGAAEIDLLRGDEAYKARWGAAPQQNRRRVFKRPAMNHAAA